MKKEKLIEQKIAKEAKEKVRKVGRA